MRVSAAAGVVALALGALAHGAAGAPKTSCPANWAKGWQRLADKVAAPVYCPTWMPNPLDARIGGQYEDIYSIGKDRSYLVSFLEHGDLGSGDVHVNFRAYPGRTTIPRCPAPAWWHAGSLYSVSQHVINPYDSATRIRENLQRLLKGLVLVQPAG